MNEVTFTCEEHTDASKLGWWIEDKTNSCKCDQCANQAKWAFVPVSDEDVRNRMLPDGWRTNRPRGIGDGDVGVE